MEPLVLGLFDDDFSIPIQVSNRASYLLEMREIYFALLDFDPTPEGTSTTVTGLRRVQQVREYVGNSNRPFMLWYSREEDDILSLCVALADEVRTFAC